MSSASQVPRLADFLSRKETDFSAIVLIRCDRPSGRGKRRAFRQRCAEEVDARFGFYPAAHIHPPAITAPGDSAVGDTERIRERGISVSRIEHLRLSSWKDSFLLSY